MKKIHCFDSVTIDAGPIILNGAIGDLSLEHYCQEFIDSEYSFIDPTGKSVLDLGASYGDFANWCHVNGAKSIISIEANPFIFNHLLRNTYELQFRLNFLALNVAIANSAKAKFTFKSHGTGAGSLDIHSKLNSRRKNKKSVTVDCLDLSTILDFYKPKI